MSNEEVLNLEQSHDGTQQEDELDDIIDWGKVPPELEKEIKDALKVLKNNKSKEELDLFKMEYGDFIKPSNVSLKDTVKESQKKQLLEEDISDTSKINEYILSLDPELKSRVEGKVSEWKKQIESKKITDPVLATFFSTKPDVKDLQGALTSLALLSEEQSVYSKYSGNKQKLEEFKSAFTQLKSSFQYQIVPDSVGKFVQGNHIGEGRAFIAGEVISRSKSAGFDNVALIDNVYYSSKGHSLLSPERKKQIYVGTDGIETIDTLGNISIRRSGFENIDNKEYDKWNKESIGINDHLLEKAKHIPNYAGRENNGLLKPTSNERNNYINTYNYLQNNYEAVGKLYEQEFLEEESVAKAAGLDKVEETPELVSLQKELKIIEDQITELLSYSQHFDEENIPKDHLGEIDTSDKLIENNLNMLDMLGFQHWGTDNMNTFLKNYNFTYKTDLNFSIDKLTFSDSRSRHFIETLSSFIGNKQEGFELQESLQTNKISFGNKMKDFISQSKNVDAIHSQYKFSENISSVE